MPPPTPPARPPVVVIGAGPVGLAAATHLLERRLTPVILEAGDQPAASVTATPEPPTARFCRVTDQLLRSVRGWQFPLPGTTPNTSASVRELAGHGVGGSSQDWGTVTCCQQPARIPIPPPATSAR
jgi:cation diffusion facilitator CzcD-associated flavoprotein CzcO